MIGDPPGLRVIFCSHDGFGLGHVRRNTRLAAALLRRVPDAHITLVTGLDSTHPWLDRPGWRVERVPSLVKSVDGDYRNDRLSYAEVLRERSTRFARLVEEIRPDLVVVDRHPFGTGGDLRVGLDLARRAGAAVVLGLRDIIDDPMAVRRELAGGSWAGAAETYDRVLVYGSRSLCDHEREYGLPFRPEYCGVVTAPLVHAVPATDAGDLGALVVAAGGGGDGASTMELGRRLAGRHPFGRTVLVTGPSGADVDAAAPGLEVLRQVDDCGRLFATAGATVQMAGYNSTYEALTAGIRPVLVPRRRPRREQAIRASRLAGLGLADVVDEGASVEEIAWLLEQPRRLGPDALVRAGIHLDGAGVAAELMADLVGPARRVVA